MNVTYQLEPDLPPEEFIDVLMRSTLAERRPIHDLETIRAMLRNGDVILTARLAVAVVDVMGSTDLLMPRRGRVN